MSAPDRGVSGATEQSGRHAWLAGPAAALLVALLLWASGLQLLGALRAVLAVIWLVGVPGLALARGLDLGQARLDRLALAAVLGTVMLGPLFNLLTLAAAPLVEPAWLLLAWPLPFVPWLVLTRRKVPRASEPGALVQLSIGFLVLVLFLALLYLPAYWAGPDGSATLCLGELMINARSVALHVALADRYGLEPGISFPFVAGRAQTLIHLHSYSLMNLLGRLSGCGALAAELRLYPLFSMVLALLALRHALGVIGGRSAGARTILVALLGSPLLVLLYGPLPQTLLACAVLATAVALAHSGLQRGRWIEIVLAGLLLGSLAQIDLHWAVAVLPGAGLAAIWPRRGSRDEPGEPARWRPLRHGLVLGLAAGSGALLVTGLALGVTDLGQGPLLLALGPGSFLGFAAERAAAHLRSAPALVGGGAIAVLLLYGLSTLLARGAWRGLSSASRRLLLGPALASLLCLVLVETRATPVGTGYFAPPALLSLALLAALGLHPWPAWLARVPRTAAACALAGPGLLMALAAALTPCAGQAAISAEEAAALRGVAAATDPREPVAARDREPAALALWCGTAGRPLAGVVVDEMFVPKMDEVYRMPGIAQRAEQVQRALGRLAAAPTLEDAERALLEIDARIVELPASAALPAGIGHRLQVVAGTSGSVYYRLAGADPGGGVPR